ncbi:hypothetical protein KAS08_00275 [Candidatus Pacearchaeota archaeon]|nr:hypothetical protein [Candidatus Pacearchaeota archaeon]
MSNDYIDNGFEWLWFDEPVKRWKINHESFLSDNLGLYDIITADKTKLENVSISIDSNNNLVLDLFGECFVLYNSSNINLLVKKQLKVMS